MRVKILLNFLDGKKYYGIWFHAVWSHCVSCSMIALCSAQYDRVVFHAVWSCCVLCTMIVLCFTQYDYVLFRTTWSPVLIISLYEAHNHHVCVSRMALLRKFKRRCQCVPSRVVHCRGTAIFFISRDHHGMSRDLWSCSQRWRCAWRRGMCLEMRVIPDFAYPQVLPGTMTLPWKTANMSWDGEYIFDFLKGRTTTHCLATDIIRWSVGISFLMRRTRTHCLESVNIMQDGEFSSSHSWSGQCSIPRLCHNILRSYFRKTRIPWKARKIHWTWLLTWPAVRHDEVAVSTFEFTYRMDSHSQGCAHLVPAYLCSIIPLDRVEPLLAKVRCPWNISSAHVPIRTDWNFKYRAAAVQFWISTFPMNRKKVLWKKMLWERAFWEKVLWQKVLWQKVLSSLWFSICVAITISDVCQWLGFRGRMPAIHRCTNHVLSSQC